MTVRIRLALHPGNLRNTALLALAALPLLTGAALLRSSPASSGFDFDQFESERLAAKTASYRGTRTEAREEAAPTNTQDPESRITGSLVVYGTSQGARR
jgi:hypothetical protein